MIYRFNAIPVKITASYSVDIDKVILKFIWKSRILNTVLKENIGEGLILLDFKTYYKATAIKGVWFGERICK